MVFIQAAVLVVTGANKLVKVCISMNKLLSDWLPQDVATRRTLDT